MICIALIFVKAATNAKIMDKDTVSIPHVIHLEASKLAKKIPAVIKLPNAATRPTNDQAEVSLLLLLSTYSTPFTVRTNTNIKPSPIKLEIPRSHIFCALTLASSVSQF